MRYKMKILFFLGVACITSFAQAADFGDELKGLKRIQNDKIQVQITNLEKARTPSKFDDIQEIIKQSEALPCFQNLQALAQTEEEIKKGYSTILERLQELTSRIKELKSLEKIENAEHRAKFLPFEVKQPAVGKPLYSFRKSTPEIVFFPYLRIRAGQPDVSGPDVMTTKAGVISQERNNTVGLVVVEGKIVPGFNNQTCVFAEPFEASEVLNDEGKETLAVLCDGHHTIWPTVKYLIEKEFDLNTLTVPLILNKKHSNRRITERQLWTDLESERKAAIGYNIDPTQLQAITLIHNLKFGFPMRGFLRPTCVGVPSKEEEATKWPRGTSKHLITWMQVSGYTVNFAEYDLQTALQAADFPYTPATFDAQGKETTPGTKITWKLAQQARGIFLDIPGLQDRLNIRIVLDPRRAPRVKAERQAILANFGKLASPEQFRDAYFASKAKTETPATPVVKIHVVGGAGETPDAAAANQNAKPETDEAASA